jgi:hypothetical protein
MQTPSAKCIGDASYHICEDLDQRITNREAQMQVYHTGLSLLYPGETSASRFALVGILQN